jgi:hypothetical protein
MKSLVGDDVLRSALPSTTRKFAGGQHREITDEKQAQVVQSGRDQAGVRRSLSQPIKSV